MVYVYHVCDHCHVIRTVYSACTCIWCTDTLHLYIIKIVSLERGCDDVAVEIKSRSSPHDTSKCKFLHQSPMELLQVLLLILLYGFILAHYIDIILS